MGGFYPTFSFGSGTKWHIILDVKNAGISTRLEYRTCIKYGINLRTNHKGNKTMRTANIIMNIQDTGKDVAKTLAYLTHWEIAAKAWLRKCSICENDARPWYVIVRRTARAMTVKCKNCGFQFTFTYRNLRKGVDGLARFAGQEPDKDWLDILETRGRQAVTA